jgi:hypothetical protein
MEEANQRAFIVYKKNDFILYVFSLLVLGALSAVALHGWVEIGVVQVLLAYMIYCFVMRHGASWDATCFPELFRGLITFPGYVGGLMRMRAKRLLAPALVFAVALTAEFAARRWLPGSFWTHAVPYYEIFAIHFLVVTAFRTVVLGSHLARAATVRDVLETAPSNWRRMMKSLSVENLCFHSYVTGVLTHLAAWLPCLLFWKLTGPTWSRELVILGAAVAWRLAVVRVRGMTRLDIAHQLFFADFASLRSIGQAFESSHEKAHYSRFHFTVLHGHHHDAIPSSLLGSAPSGSGIGENLERTFYFGWLFWSVVGTAITHTYAVIFDMVGHQFIPGIFPFSRWLVRRRRHHVVHHYGKIRPLGFLGSEPGYSPANAVASWFAGKVRDNEGATDAECELYVQAEKSSLEAGR